MYGFLVEAPGVIFPNIFGLGLGLYYWWVFEQHCPQDADWLPSTKSAHMTCAWPSVQLIDLP